MKTLLVLLCGAASVLAQTPGTCAMKAVNAQTASYTALLTDSGNFITMSGSSLTLTLPSTAPAAAPMWCVRTVNLNSTALLISPNGLNLNGQSGNFTLPQYGSAEIFSDGANYFISTSGGMSISYGAGGGFSPATSTQYWGCNPGGLGNPQTANTDLRSRCYFPAPHLLTSFLLAEDVRGTLGSNTNFTVNVLKNGSALSPTCTFANVNMSSAGPNLYSGSAGCTFLVAAQDYIQLNYTTPGGTGATTTDWTLSLNMF